MLKLSKYLFIVFIGINSQLVAAQPALFENSVLTIPTGAAIVNGEPIYYNDIQLISDIEGNFSLLAAQRSNLVSVNSVSLLINITQPIPDQVNFAVTGHKSIPCVELQAPAVFQDDHIHGCVGRDNARSCRELHRSTGPFRDYHHATHTRSSLGHLQRNRQWHRIQLQSLAGGTFSHRRGALSP